MEVAVDAILELHARNDDDVTADTLWGPPPSSFKIMRPFVCRVWLFVICNDLNSFYQQACIKINCSTKDVQQSAFSFICARRVLLWHLVVDVYHRPGFASFSYVMEKLVHIW